MSSNNTTTNPATGTSPNEKENKKKPAYASDGSNKPALSLSTSPSAKPGSITSWGSTSGKLYLSSPRLDDPKSKSAVTDYFCGAQGNSKQDQEGGDAKQNGTGGG